MGASKDVLVVLSRVFAQGAPGALMSRYSPSVELVQTLRCVSFRPFVCTSIGNLKILVERDSKLAKKINGSTSDGKLLRTAFSMTMTTSFLLLLSSLSSLDHIENTKLSRRIKQVG